MIEDYKVISVVGNAKNAGKTTVINHLIDDCFDHVIAITSIGLDGEEIDQVTFQNKPRIFAYENFYIATAENTLKTFEAEYEIIEETDIDTSIGKVVIVRVTKPGNVLVAGPSVISKMQKLISTIEKYNPEKIFIDGAFFRHSTAKISQATILVIGANLSANIDKVINNAKMAVKKFDLPEYKDRRKLEEMENVCFLDNENNLIEMDFQSVLGMSSQIFLPKNKDYRYIYLPKALTNDFVKELVNKRKEYSFNIIVNSPVNIQLDESNLDNLFKLKNNIYVLDSVNLVALCYNPTSPRGYNFDDKEFKEKLSKITGMDVINVEEEEIYE